MLAKYLAYIPSIVGIASLVAFILLNNYKNKVNRLFAVLIGTGCLWILCLFIADTVSSTSKALWAVRAGVSINSLLGPIFLVFSENFPISVKNKIKNILLIFTPAVVLAILALTGLMIRGVVISNSGANLNGTSFLYSIDTIATAAYFGLGAWQLFKKRKSSDSIQTTQINIVLVSVMIVFISNLIGNYLLPLADQNTNANLFASSSLFLFAVLLSYAMIKHKLFDVRLIVARSLVYALSLFAIVALFIAGVIALTGLFLGNESVNTLSVKVTYTSIAVVVAFLFQPLKRFFDRFTNRLFFRDAYDVQVFLDQFNKVIVSSFELTTLLRKVTDLIDENIKPSYCMFGIKESYNKPRRIMGTKGYPHFSEEEIAYVRSMTPHMNQKMIVTDVLEDKYSSLKSVLQKKNVSILVRLTSATKEEGIGYLVLGPRKSGNMYNSQDIRVLSIVTNELVVAIQNALHNEEIENFNLTLQEKIKNATHRLRSSNEKLKQLDEAKDDFVSMASHQLRTPLTSVKGNISLVLDGDAGEITPIQRQLLEQAFTSSQRMVFLIADLLNVSRLKTGKFIIERVPVDLANVVEEEINQLIDTAKSRHLTLSYEKPEHISELMLDETKTRQVVMNFIDNAIYYTPAEGRIDVVLSETPTAIECRVIDNGIGVPKAEQHHLFTKFYRAGNARKARPDGTGLGLFMAKKVIVSEGGALIFETEEGKGSTFGFSFPKSKLAVNAVDDPLGNEKAKEATVA